MRKQILKSLLVVLSVVFLMTGLTAQTAKLRKAALYMESLRYDDAISVYEKVIRKNETDLTALLGLAEAHQKLDQLTEAAAWYAKALEQPEVSAVTFYSYGQVLFQKGECTAAQSAFTEFLRRKPYDQRADRLRDVCSYYDRLRSGDAQQIEVSLPDFNGPYSDLAPAFFRNGIVFGSVRRTEKRKEAYYDLYFTCPVTEDQPDGLGLSYTQVDGFSAMLNGSFNEAIVTFGPDFKEVFFTRNQEQLVSEKRPIRRLEVMVSRQGADSSWSKPQPLAFNSINYSTAHPALTPDGSRLFFASDRPGGFGGKDIYYCDRIGLGWSAPINLGPQVNTEGDELYPYYHANGQLYFASNGQLGLGGLDIFRVEDLGGGEWGRADNPGAPINSTADDFALIMKADESYGFLTSNRAGGAGSDDIYAFQRRRVQVQLQFVTQDDHILRESVPFALRGEDYMQFTDDKGYWTAWLEPEDCLYLQVRHTDYLMEKREVCAAQAEGKSKLSLKWLLSPRTTEEVLAADAETGEQKTSQLLSGKVLDQLDGEPVAFAQIVLRDDDCGGIVNITTDAEGHFTYQAEEECCFTLTVNAEGYFKYQEDVALCTAAWPREIDLRLVPFRLREHQEFQARTTAATDKSFQLGQQVYADADRAIPYLLNVYYDLGRASVRPEAISELNRLYWLLENNPQITVEVGSHTDSQGTASFNERLSQRRANAIVKFLTDKGIPRKRLQARGYGETRLVNECADGVECDEAAHQLNRRTEFRVLEEEVGQSN